MDLTHGVGLLRVGERRRVGDQLGVAGDEGLDDAKAGGLEGPAGLGDVDHDVDDVGNLCFGGAVRETDVGVDASSLEVALRDLGIFGRDLHPRRQVGDRLPRRVLRHRHHDAHRLGGGFRVLQLAERLDLARGFFDPVAARDAEVEEPLGHIGRDLLGTENPHRCDAGVIDRSLVGDRRRPLDRKVGGLEEFHGGLLQRALGEDEVQHGGSLGTGGEPRRGYRPTAIKLRV